MIAFESIESQGASTESLDSAGLFISFVVGCSAGEIISFAQVVVAQDQHRCCFDNKALKLADHVINVVQNDPHGIQSLQELRTQFLKHAYPRSNQAHAIAMKYCHHFAAVRGAGDAESESLEHKELLDRLTWIDLKMPEPRMQRPFALHTYDHPGIDTISNIFWN